MEDLIAVAERTGRVLGLPRERGGSGYPGPFTALGAFAAIRGCVGDPTGVRVAVLGTGSVGAGLVRLLLEAGAEVYAADLDEEKARATGAVVVGPNEIYDVPADVFSPNARGPALTRETAPRLTSAFVAGAANGQLEDPAVGAFLIGRGIRYVPEEIAGSGWILSLAAELEPGGWTEEGAREKVLTIEGLAC
jgi:leucine dehydrogenase